MAEYRHVGRAKGTVLTKAIYDADHQNHIDFGEAQYLGGCSGSLAQFQTTIDPGGVGSEVVPASISDYIQELRYVLKNMMSEDQWYQKTVIKEVPLPFYVDHGGDPAAHGHGFAPDGPTRYMSVWPQLGDYAGGVVEVRWYAARDSAAGGDARYNKLYGVLASGNAWAGGNNSINTVTYGDDLQHAILMNVPEAAMTATAPGDAMIFSIWRDGGHAGDTLTVRTALMGVTVTYNAYTGR